jgi:hypothetical protein
METREARPKRNLFLRIDEYLKKDAVLAFIITWVLLAFCWFGLFYFTSMVPSESEIQEYQSAAEVYLTGDEKIKENFNFSYLHDNQLWVYDTTGVSGTFKYIYDISEGAGKWQWYEPAKLRNATFAGVTCGLALTMILYLIVLDKRYSKEPANDENQKERIKSKTERYIIKGICIFARAFGVLLLTAEIILIVYMMYA